ncbi:hypothetical protein FGIG_04354 [Fasciola gigantica]|uniref:Beta-1,4-galactosyltransferase n=1 Tax=Fasciola gigantica TaxID=46835 RepID=A0A504Z2P1_FASGI|nr:hypothetical protein FGIG_04354 [Fasciola gigantica]
MSSELSINLSKTESLNLANSTRFTYYAAMGDYPIAPRMLGLVSFWDSHMVFNSRRILNTLSRVLRLFAVVLIMIMLFHLFRDQSLLRQNPSGKDSFLFRRTGLVSTEKDPFYPFTKFIWYTFYRFIDPELLTVHANATWYALSLFTDEYETMDPSARNEYFEDKLSEQLKRENITVQRGGYYDPDGRTDLTDCDKINETLTILIPYRKRAHNLLAFLSYMHRYLPLKFVHYRIVVLEQINLKAFNRAKLFNAGLRELGVLIGELKRPFTEDNSTLHNCTSYCFVLHDVDKLPVSMQTPYECSPNPLQLARIAVARNKSATWVGNNRLEKGKSEHWFYDSFFGGVTIVNKRHIRRVNGLSNSFFGWGGEDDDFRKRMNKCSLSVQNISRNQSRYYFLDHPGDSAYNKRAPFLLRDHRVLIRMHRDGIRQTRYTVRGRIVRPLYTLYQISV